MNETMTKLETPLQDIELEDISGFSKVLDVGAGGEGLAARIGKEKVYGVDIRVDEIKEVRSRNVNCNWIVCDARKLCFKNETFNLVTLWFSLMYITRAKDKAQVLSECKRVLAKSGILHLIDVEINTQEKVFIMNARFKLPSGEVVDTGYGVTGSQKQTLSWLKTELIKLRFEIIKEHAEEYWFNLVCKK